MRIITKITSTLLLSLVIATPVFAYTNGSINSTVKINESTLNGPGALVAQDQYAVEMANIGDLDGDGVNDILVGANGNDTGAVNAGAAYIHFMNYDGSIKSTVKLSTTTPNGPSLLVSDFYGVAVEGIGDLNNDGVPDIAVGANGDDTGGVSATNRGAFYIHYMNRDGSIISTVKISVLTSNGATGLAVGDRYATRIANTGDLDGDGINDLAVSSSQDDTGGTNRGAIYIHYMNRDGSIKSSVKIADGTLNGPTLADNDQYGFDVKNIGDLDGDGINDIGVGAWQDDTGGTDRGAFYIHYMNRNGSIKSTVKITGNTPNGATLANSDKYGDAIVNLGDLNNDGSNDIAVSAIGDSGFKGAWYVHFMTPTPGVVVSKTSLSVSEGGSSDSFTMRLLSKPSVDVNVALSLSTNQSSLSASSLIFTPSDWDIPKALTVNAVDDSVVEISQSDTISFVLTSADSSYNGYSVSSIPVTITDNDTFRSSRGGGIVYCSDTLSSFCRPKILDSINQDTNLVGGIKYDSKNLFTKILKVGSQDDQVLYLQKFLNDKGYEISKKGVGSPGKESKYFGLSTKKALIRFQKANNLESKSGVFGKESMSFVNKLNTQ